MNFVILSEMQWSRKIYYATIKMVKISPQGRNNNLYLPFLIASAK